MRYIVLCLLFFLQSFHLHAQHVQYLNARDIVEMAKSSGKPYLWVALYIPKCANAEELFSERVALYNKHQDKLDLVMLTVLESEDNKKILRDYCRQFDFSTAYYAMDSSYAANNISERPAELQKDLADRLGVEFRFAQHIIISSQGELVYWRNDIDGEAMDRVLK